MRKITQNAITAFYANKNFSSSNTIVDTDSYSTRLLLHGNCIAEKIHNKGIQISTCGWNTPTTKERLNGLVNVSVNTSKGQLYLNGKEWDGEKTFVPEFEYIHIDVSRWFDGCNTYFTGYISYKTLNGTASKDKYLEFSYGYGDGYLNDVLDYFSKVLDYKLETRRDLQNLTRDKIRENVYDVKRKKHMINGGK